MARDLSATVRGSRSSGADAGAGDGAPTAIFSVVKAVLLNSLPYRQPDRLVTLAQGDAQTPNPVHVSYAEVEDWKVRNQSFQQIALYRGWTSAASHDGVPGMVFGLRVTRNFFDLLGVSPRLGRGFLPEEDRPDRWHVVILSHPFWVRQFGGNENVVGQTILLNQVPFQIVGVLPQNFDPLSFTDAGGPSGRMGAARVRPFASPTPAGHASTFPRWVD